MEKENASKPFYTFAVAGDRQTGWVDLLTSLGLARVDVPSMDPQGPSVRAADLLVLPAGTVSPELEALALARMNDGGIVIFEGASPLAEELGFRPTQDQIEVQSLEEMLAPELRVIWEDAGIVAAVRDPLGGEDFFAGALVGA